MGIGTYLLIVGGLFLAIFLSFAFETTKYQGAALVFAGVCGVVLFIMLVPVFLVGYIFVFIVIIAGVKALLSR